MMILLWKCEPHKCGDGWWKSATWKSLLMGLNLYSINVLLYIASECSTFLFTLRFLLYHLISSKHASRRNLTIIIAFHIIFEQVKCCWCTKCFFSLVLSFWLYLTFTVEWNQVLCVCVHVNVFMWLAYWMKCWMLSANGQSARVN